MFFLFLIGTISDSFLRTRHYPCTMRGGGEEGGGRGLRVIWECYQGRISCRRQNMKGNYRKLAANSLPTRKGYKNVIKPYGRSGKFYRDITIIPPSPPQAIKNDHYLWFSYRSVLDIDECAVDNGGCSYGCQNLQGRYICTCPIGFELDRTQKNSKGIYFFPFINIQVSLKLKKNVRSLIRKACYLLALRLVIYKLYSRSPNAPGGFIA